MATCPVGHPTADDRSHCVTCGRPVPDRESTTLLAAPVPPRVAGPTTQFPVQPSPVQPAPAHAGPAHAGPAAPPVPGAPPPVWSHPAPTAPPVNTAPPANGGYAYPQPAAPPMPQYAPPPAPTPPGPVQHSPTPHSPTPHSPARHNAPAGGGAPVGLTPGVAPPYRFELRRLTVADRVIATSAVVLFVALWLPWFHFQNDFADASVGGINTHSWLAFALLTCVVLIVYLAARAGWDRMPIRIPIAHAPLLLVVGIIQFGIVLIAFLSTPQDFGHTFGAWLALIAALGALLPIALPALQAASRPRP